MNKILSVSQINNYIKGVFDDELMLQNITVEGEVFEAKYSGGNTYITLKEGDYVLPCAKFGSRFEFSAGDKVRVTGSVRFYPRGGKMTFVVTYATAAGKGDLLIKFNELKEKLKAEGVFDNRKRLPRFIKKIALVTSVEGAVIHDFTGVLASGGCGYLDIDVYGVRVQGAEAESSIVKAISAAAFKNYDVMVIARGGGSGTDLGCFNTEGVARGVFGCQYPTISAIGHEVDYTLCDFAASVRAGTPSIAADIIVRNNEAFLGCFYERLAQLRAKAESMLSSVFFRAKRLSSDLILGSERKSSEMKNKLVAFADKMFRVCDGVGAEADKRTVRCINQLGAAAQLKLADCEGRLKLSAAVLDKTSPLKILSSGYAKVMRDGVAMDDARKIAVGDKLKVVMSGGSLGVTVNQKE